MAGRVEQYRNLVDSVTGAADNPADAADAAVELYGEDYYKDPAAYEDAVVSARLAALAPTDPRRLALSASSLADLSPDANFAAVTAGLSGNSEAVQSLRELDRAATEAEFARQQLQRASAENAELSRQRLRDSQSGENDMWDWGPANFLKGAVRNGFAALSAPFEIIRNSWMAYGAFVTSANDNTVGDAIFNIFTGTQLGYMSQQIARGMPLDTGDGWLGVDPESGAGQGIERLQADLWTLENGDIATPGRAMAENLFLDKDSTAYSVVSGPIDLMTYILDPAMWVGVGAARGSLKVLSAYQKGGKTAADAQRAINSGAAIGKGVSAAREADDAFQSVRDELDDLITERDRLVAQAADAEAQGATAAERAARAGARYTTAEAGKARATEAATAAREEARSVWRAGVERLAQRRKELEKAAAQSDTVARNLNEVQTRLDEIQEELSSLTARPAESAAPARAADDAVSEVDGGDINAAIDRQVQRAEGRVARRRQTERAAALREERKALQERLRVIEDEAFASGVHDKAARGARRARGGRVTRIRTALESRRAAINDELDYLNSTSRYNPLLDEARVPMQRAEEAEAAARSAANEVSVSARLVDEATAQADELVTRANRLDEEARAAAAEVDEMASLLAQRFGLETEEVDGVLRARFGDSVDELSEAEKISRYLADELGLIDLPTGKRVFVNQALQSIFKGKLDGVANAIARIKDPVVLFDLMRGKVADPAVLRALAKADTPEQVKTVLAHALARNDLSHTVGKLKALRAYSRMVGDRPVVDEANAYAEAFGTLAKPLRWSMNAKERRVPWSYDIHIEDAAQMLRGTADYIAFATRKWKDETAADEFYSKWVGRMMNATSGEGRKAVAFDMLNDLTEVALRESGDLSPEDVEKVKEVFKSSRSAALNKIVYNANERALSGDDLIIDGVRIDHANIPMLESMLNERFMFPDPRKVQRLVKSAAAIRKRDGDPNIVGEMYRTVFDDFWRTTILLKASYIVRNVLEIQQRLALGRFPSFFTNPLGMLALMSDGTRLEKVFSKFRLAELDATGTRFVDNPAADDAVNEYLDEFGRMTSGRYGALLDVGSPRMQAQYQRAGYTLAKYGEEGFWSGAANEVVLLNTSPLARAVLGVSARRPSKEIVDYATENGLDLEDAVVALAMRGDGELARGLRGMRDASRDDNLKTVLSTPSGVKDFLFGRANEFSYWSRWNNYTNGFDLRFVDELWSGKYDKRAGTVAGSKDDVAAAKEQNSSLARTMDNLFGTSARNGEYRVVEVGVPDFAPAPKQGNVVGRAFNQGTDWFYDFAGRVEWSSSGAPVQRFSYWETVAEVVAGMSPAEAKKLVATARKSLRGKTSAWEYRTLKNIEKAAKDADGALTVDEVHRIGSRQAAKKTEEMLYVAAQRNQLAHSLRLIFPFAQAWANSMLVYGRLASQNSEVLYRAGTLFEAGQATESNVIYEVAGSLPWDPMGLSLYDPEQGFIYNTPFGRASVQLPFASTAVGTIAGGGTGRIPLGIDTPLESMNVVFQDGLGPGFSPMAQAVGDVVGRTSFYKSLPDFLKFMDIPVISKQMEMFQDPNSPDQGPFKNFLSSVLPDPVESLLNLTGADFAERSAKYEQAAASHLFSANPDRYMQGLDQITPEGMALLQADAESLGRGLAFGQTWTKFVSPGSIVPRMYAEGNDGTLYAQYELGLHFDRLIARYEGDYQLAFAAMEDIYGTQVLHTLAPTRKAGTFPTTETWEWLQDNPDVNLDPGTLEMFFSGDTYSPQFARFLNRVGTGQKLTVEEQSYWTNSLLYRGRVDTLKRRRDSGELSEEQYVATRNDLDQLYAPVLKREMDRDRQAREVGLLQDALTRYPQLEETDGGFAVSVYLKLREAARQDSIAKGNLTFDLSQNNMAEWRAWLLAQGEVLRQQHPGFDDAWEYVFKREVEEN